MRWIWIDKFIEFTSRQSATAVKACSLAEEHVHDLYPQFPIVPHSLIVEGMAQTAGMLVGEARDFKEKVVLAKVGRATFHQLVRPGDTLFYHARVEQMHDQGASISGVVEAVGNTMPDSDSDVKSENTQPRLVAEIELMFSHIDQNMAGLKFPEENFVFNQSFIDLFKNFRRGMEIKV
jgi:3-hydroxyacyl-[acyl-carrier-protein] dehydratase